MLNCSESWGSLATGDGDGFSSVEGDSLWKGEFPYFGFPYTYSRQGPFLKKINE